MAFSSPPKNASAKTSASHKRGTRLAATLPTKTGHDKLQLFWGDLHNHNAVGYAKGSLQRSIDLAREHLDFFAFTGHASWHDMPKMPGDRHMKWVNGFKVHSDHWPKTMTMLQEANDDDFVAMLGYEWHSSRFGDYCIIHPQHEGELFLPNHVDKLLDYAHFHGALAIPHHVGYKQGWRGANWDHFRQHASAVVEIFSEHGCTENVQASYPMIRHSMGGRSTANCIQHQLAKGLRFGFVASTDDHLGYPGAYGEGAVGVWATDLSQPALFEAINARRTYAITGDRIGVEMTLNGYPMGSEIPFDSQRQIDVRVESPDSIEMIELVRNGKTIQRHFLADEIDDEQSTPAKPSSGHVKCRIQYGWGPWAALGLGRICDWDFTVSVDQGRITRAWPCFQNSPFDEQRRDTLRIVNDKQVHVTSPTSRVGCYAEDPTKSIVLELEGNAETSINMNLTQPNQQSVTIPLQALQEENHVEFVGEFTSESFIIHGLVTEAESSAVVRWEDKQPQQKEQADWYYIRVRQHNGHMAWTSPVWI